MKDLPKVFALQWALLGFAVGGLFVALIPRYRPSPDEYEAALNAYYHAQMDLDAALAHAAAAGDDPKVSAAVKNARSAMRKAKAAAKKTDEVVTAMLDGMGRYESDGQPRPWEGGRY